VKLYVASSWRNPYQPNTVEMLRRIGHEVYDFMHPPGGDHLGFSWSEIDPNWRQWRSQQYLEALTDPIAVAGFESDFGAMQWAEGCVLLLPSGRSAHLEAGWFVGAGKPLWILLDEAEFAGIGDQTGATELMYRMATGIASSFESLALALDLHAVPA
jgi:hypothetical protein